MTKTGVEKQNKKQAVGEKWAEKKSLQQRQKKQC